MLLPQAALGSFSWIYVVWWMQQQLLLNRGGESTSDQSWPEDGWFVPIHLI